MTTDWKWRFPVLRWHIVDGDTLDLTVDVGFKIRHDIRLRLDGINCPEVRGPERTAGLAASLHAEAILAEFRDAGLPLVCETGYADGGFGRWAGDIILPGGERLTDRMVRDGHAVRVTP